MKNKKKKQKKAIKQLVQMENKKDIYENSRNRQGGK